MLYLPFQHPDLPLPLAGIFGARTNSQCFAALAPQQRVFMQQPVGPQVPPDCCRRWFVTAMDRPGRQPGTPCAPGSSSSNGVAEGSYCILFLRPTG
jgi:hypothetical protein